MIQTYPMDQVLDPAQAVPLNKESREGIQNRKSAENINPRTNLPRRDNRMSNLIAEAAMSISNNIRELSVRFSARFVFLFQRMITSMRSYLSSSHESTQNQDVELSIRVNSEDARHQSPETETAVHINPVETSFPTHQCLEGLSNAQSKNQNRIRSNVVLEGGDDIESVEILSIPCQCPEEVINDQCQAHLPGNESVNCTFLDFISKIFSRWASRLSEYLPEILVSIFTKISHKYSAKTEKYNQYIQKNPTIKIYYTLFWMGLVYITIAFHRSIKSQTKSCYITSSYANTSLNFVCFLFFSNLLHIYLNNFDIKEHKILNFMVLNTIIHFCYLFYATSMVFYDRPELFYFRGC